MVAKMHLSNDLPLYTFLAGCAMGLILGWAFKRLARD